MKVTLWHVNKIFKVCLVSANFGISGHCIEGFECSAKDMVENRLIGKPRWSHQHCLHTFAMLLPAQCDKRGELH